MSNHSGSVAVVGAGLAGLATGAALGQKGFSVQIFERSDEPREFGAGIYLKENSLPILDALGIGDAVCAAGERMNVARIVDERRRTIVSRDVSGERLVILRREDLHQILLSAALDAGAELMTRRTALGARSDGTVEFADGSSIRADVVIAADGVHSAIRDGLDLLQSYRRLPDGATRVLIPRQEEPIATEYWAGPHRVGVVPCHADWTYVFMIGPEARPQVRAIPVDREYWKSLYPHIADVFDRIPDAAGVHHPHLEVICTSWVSGRVALLGDAAHAQPPNFGQGAGVAFVAAWELARTLADLGVSSHSLHDWERRIRPTIDTVQRLTMLYTHIGYRWPAPALRARADLFHWLAAMPWTAKRWEFWWRGGTWAPWVPDDDAGALSESGLGSDMIDASHTR
jgi:2-polyprenyl-6-methoxyphenol hydroxylase-like FAD-dependent oxidoreductase